MIRHVGLWSAVFLAVGWGCVRADTFEDQNHAYTITFPKGWTVDENDANNIAWVTARSPAEKEGDSYLENIQITYNQKASKTTLKDYLPEMLRFMKEKYAQLDVLEIGSTEIAGTEAKWILFTSQGPSETGKQIQLKAIHYVLVADQHLMIILCVAPVERFDEWKPTFEQSLKTLKFL